MFCWLRGIPKQKKHIVVLDDKSMNASTKRLKYDEQSSLADFADVPRHGYFLENHKPSLKVRFLKLKSTVPILILAGSNSLTLQ
jgi:hypothetical protein